LRQCYWFHKCSIRINLEKKKKEIRDKLKVSNNLIDLLKQYGPEQNNVREWIRQAVGVIYQLMCAGFSDQYNKKVSFEKEHDFFLENKPVEVKTIFSPIEVKYA
jgi:hypothetical protein